MREWACYGLFDWFTHVRVLHVPKLAVSKEELNTTVDMGGLGVL